MELSPGCLVLARHCASRHRRAAWSRQLWIRERV